MCAAILLIVQFLVNAWSGGIIVSKTDRACVGFGALSHVRDVIIRILVMRQSGTAGSLVQNVGDSVCGIEGVDDRRTVSVRLPCHAISGVITQTRRF